MDLQRLETAIREAIGRGREATLDVLQRREAVNGELALAAGTLADRLEVADPAAPDDPRQPWM